MPNMDWKKEASGDFEVYPAGSYHVRIVGHERLKAGTGTPQIRWKAEIIEPDKYRGKSILDHTALTDSALWRVAKAVLGCGVDITNLSAMDTESPQFNAVLDACKERKVFWHVIEDLYNGKMNNKVVDYKQDPDQEVIQPPELDKVEW